MLSCFRRGEENHNDGDSTFSDFPSTPESPAETKVTITTDDAKNYDQDEKSQTAMWVFLQFLCFRGRISMLFFPRISDM